MSDSSVRTPIPQGLVQRVVAGMRYMITGAGPEAWFGPFQPLQPMAPPDVAGRQFDYPVGYNLIVTPRGEAAVGFAELRALADGYDLLRLVIETRKDQMERLRWAICRRNVPPAGAGEDDPRIAAIEEFFRLPDRVHFWSTWLRQLLEDLFVLDAPALYIRRTRAGKLYALEPIDGSTVKRLINADGRTPAPPDPAYQQVLHGLPAVDLTTRDLLYRPRNLRTHRLYGYSPVEQIVMTVNIALRRQVSQLGYYTEGNVPEALIGTPESWSPQQIKEFQQYWDALLEGNLAQRRHAKFVPGGVAKTFIPTREPELKGAFDEWLARVVCFAFSVSPQAFIDHMNRATAETAQDTALAEGLAPVQTWVKQLIDYVLITEFDAPDLEFQWRDERETDPQKLAGIAQIYVTNGIKSVNEVRREIGLDPVAGGEAPLVFTGSGPVPLAQAAAGQGAAAADKADAPSRLGKYSEDQPRDWHGRWTSDGGGSAPTKPVQLATNDTGVRSDAPGAGMEQLAAGAEPEDESGRGGRGFIEDEFLDPAAPVRIERFNAAISKLRAIDPSNPQTTSIVPPDWVPSKEDVQRASDVLDRAIENAAAEAAEHAYDEHVLRRREFPEIGSEIELQLLTQNVIRNNRPQFASDGRSFFYEPSSNTLVVVNTVDPEQSTVFRPRDRAAYVEHNLIRKMVILMDAAKRSDGTVTVTLTRRQAEAVRSSLIEVCFGMWIDNFAETLGFEKSVGKELADNLDIADLGDGQAGITATPEELRILVNSMQETLKDGPGEGIPYYGYLSRVGAYPKEVREILAVLEPILQSVKRS